MLYNAGGAWDNAKKFIERGNFGGKVAIHIMQQWLVTPLAIHSRILPVPHLISLLN